jgi:DNA ligase (NAD+)
VTISRATLHNEDEIRLLDVREGDMVVVQRAGDVIPEIVRAVSEERAAGSVPFAFPSVCPACGEPVRRLSGEAAWRCVNLACPAMARESIVHFVSRAGLDVQGIGRKWIEQLVDDGTVRSPADLFRLREDALTRYERMGERLAANFVASLQKAREEATLPRLICALGIRHVGEQTARTLAGAYSDLAALAAADETALQRLPDIGPEAASAITAFFADTANQDMVRAFRDIGLWPETLRPQGRDGPLRGLNVLFTGTLSIPRAQAQNMALAAGANIAASAGRQLDILVVGDNPGSKLAKAGRLGVRIMSEQEFMAAVQAAGSPVAVGEEGGGNPAPSPI